jgi:hypothetical protein
MCLEVASTRISSTSDVNIVDSEVAAAALSAKNVIVDALLRRGTSYVPHRDILDGNAVRRLTSWSAVEVILLDVDAVDRCVLNANVLEEDVGDKTSSVGVRLDSHAILGVKNHRVRERDVCHVVV